MICWDEEMLTLDDICLQITDGSHFSPEDKGTGYPMLSVKDMRDDHFDLSECKYVDEKDYEKLLANGCKPLLNDVVLAKDGSYLKTAFTIKEEQDIALLSSIAILRPDLNKVIPDYLSYFLKSKPVYRTVSLNYISGTALKRIILKGIKKIPVEFPVLEEQQYRVYLLNYIQNIIKMRKQELSKLDDLIKARFVELFGDESIYDKEMLNDNVHEMFIGPFGSALKNEYFVAEEDSYCMVYEQKHAIQKTMDLPTRYIDEKKYNELKRFTVQGGDIIVSCRGTIGEIYSIPKDAPIGVMHPSIMKIRLKNEKYCNLFFVMMLNQYMRENIAKANGSGIKMAVTATDLGREYFIVPPMSKQNEFADFVHQVDKSKAATSQPTSYD